MMILFDEEGLFRVKRLYRELYNGDSSVEANLIFKCWYNSLWIGATLGSTIGIKPIYEDFKVRFNEFQFQNKSAYARKLFDCTLSTCLRNGIRVAWRSSLLVTLFSGASVSLAVYHNDIRFGDIVFAAAISGGFYAFHRGPKAMAASASLFGLVGIPMAGLMKLYLWAVGLSYSEFSERARQFYDSPMVERQKKLQFKEKLWRDISVQVVDDFKSYIYHQRRVDRLEEMGIVDDSFKRLRPTEGIDPKKYENINSEKN